MKKLNLLTLATFMRTETTLSTKTNHGKPKRPKALPKLPKKIKTTTPALRGKACPKGHTVCSCH